MKIWRVLVSLAAVTAGFLAAPVLAAAAMADISLPGHHTYAKYHILYRLVDADGWQYAVNDIPASTRTYRIENLRAGAKYEYSVVIVNNKGGTSISNPRQMTVFTAEQKRKQLQGRNFKPIGSTRGRAEWGFRNGAVGYRIYYRELGEERWKYSVSGLSNTTDRYVIGGLNPREGYEYLVMAVDEKGRESRVVQQVLKAR